jgi:hypothetical protein
MGRTDLVRVKGLALVARDGVEDVDVPPVGPEHQELACHCKACRSSVLQDLGHAADTHPITPHVSVRAWLGGRVRARERETVCVCE